MCVFVVAVCRWLALNVDIAVFLFCSLCELFSLGAIFDIILVMKRNDKIALYFFEITEVYYLCTS